MTDPSPPQQEDPEDTPSGSSALLIAPLVIGLIVAALVIWFIFKPESPSPDDTATGPASEGTQKNKAAGVTKEQLAIIAADDENTSKKKAKQKDATQANNTDPAAAQDTLQQPEEKSSASKSTKKAGEER